MKNILFVALIMSLSGCASFMNQTTASPLAGAEQLLAQGKFQEARDAYLSSAETGSGSPVGEEAAYRAARVLVLSGNPSRDYAQAAREFEDFLRRYPSGAFTDDALAWLAALRAMEQSDVAKLLGDIEGLSKKLDTALAERRTMESERNAVIIERDSLRAGQEEQNKRIEALLLDLDALAQSHATLQLDRDNLVKAKATLEKDVESLTQTKERLLAVKAKLEKRLRDVTAVDVKMEKERKKIK